MPERYDDGSWGEGGDPQIEAQNAPTAALNDLNAQIKNSPVYRQWIAAHRGGRNLSKDEKADLLQTLIAAGFWLDPNLRISDDASVEPISHDTRNLILVGAMLAPLAFPGSGSAGAVGATGTGGAGTTGAVGGATGGAGATSGLAGSSYVVPSASLGGAGGTAGTTAALYGGGEAGLAGSSYTVPSATLGANGGPYAGGYQNDPNFMPPGSLQNNETWFGPGGGGSQGGSGGGNGSGLPLTALRGLAAIPAIARQFGGGNGSGNGNASMPPELQQLLAKAMQRMSQQEPLFQSINAQAMAGLPTAYQR